MAKKVLVVDDEKVFVVISQDGISIVHIIQVIALESL